MSQDTAVAPHPIVEADVIVCGDADLLAQYSVVKNLTTGTRYDIFAKLVCLMEHLLRSASALQFRI